MTFLIDAMIQIVSLGTIDKHLLSEVADSISETFKMPAAIAESEQPDKSAYNPKRGQYSAQTLLGYLVLSGEKNMRILGITDVDLYVPELNFVFGLADGSSLSAIISVARFRSGHTQGSVNSRLTERALKTAIHELGHTFGLSHCRNNKCVMFFSYNLRDTDHKEKDFCRSCREIIDKVLPSEGS